MQENKIIKIDLNVWQTPTSKAKENGYSTQYISNLIRQKRLESWKIEALGLVLVKRDPKTKEKSPAVSGIELPKDFIKTKKIYAVDAKGKKTNVVSDYLKSRRKANLGLKD